MILKYPYKIDLENAIRAPLLSYGLSQHDIQCATADIFNSITSKHYFDPIVAKKAIKVIERIADIDSVSNRCRTDKYKFARYILARFLSLNGASLCEVGKCMDRKHPDIKHLLSHYNGQLRCSPTMREWQKQFDLIMNKPE